MAILLLHRNQSSIDVFKKHSDSSIFFSTVYKPYDWDLIVKWGNSSSIPEGIPELNNSDALNNLNDDETLRKIFKINKISYQNGPTTKADLQNFTDKLYRVHMVDLFPIKVGLLRGSSFATVQDFTNKRTDRIIRTARKALYCLGLHFGRVDVILDAKKRVHVSRISANPRLTANLAKQYIDAFKECADLRSAISETYPDTIILGADPEFIMTNNTREDLVFASDYFKKDGLVGYDNQSYRKDRKRFPIAEIRPDPTPDPKLLIDRIRQGLKTASYDIDDPKVVWLAGSTPFAPYTTGGHIHFSGIRPTTELLKTLDNYLAVPCMLLENPKRAQKRRPKYGYLGDFRSKLHGGFEYRTPASWLVEPRIAEAVLHLAKLIVLEYRNLKYDFFTKPKIVSDFYRAYKDTFKTHFDEIWEDIAGTSYYQSHHDEISIFKSMIDSDQVWSDLSDIRLIWTR